MTVRTRPSKSKSGLPRDAILSAALVIASTGPLSAEPLDQVLSTWRLEHDVMGVSVSCQVGDRAISAGSGSANQTGATFNETTRTLVGSVSKMMTSVSIAQLVERGDIAISDPVSNWVEFFPNSQDITIAQLLSMETGTFDYFAADPSNPFIGTILADVTRQWRPETLLSELAAFPPPAAPGTGHSYSNTDYILAGMVVEAVASRTLPAVLEIGQFSPLGLSDTELVNPNTVLEGVADGYVRDSAFLFGQPNETWVGAEDYAGLLSLGWAAGGVVSTTSELANWMSAFAAGALVSSDIVETLVYGGDLSSNYGLGFERFETAYGPAFGHHGSLPGFTAFVVHFEDSDLSLAIASNDEGADGLLLDLALTLAAIECGNAPDL